jgi:uncharacterized protein
VTQLNSRPLLIVFTRLPVPGSAKTRLIPLLGANAAAELQSFLTARIIDTAKRFSETDATVLEVHYSDGTEDALRDWLGNDLKFRAQEQGDIGRRMAAAFEACFREGYSPIVLIGSDCPDISEELLREAFLRLTSADLVLGTAYDGGYYLIGMKEHHPGLFASIEWGTSTVLSATIKQAEKLDLAISLVDKLIDIDDAESLKMWLSGLKDKSILPPALIRVLSRIKDR